MVTEAYEVALIVSSFYEDVGGWDFVWKYRECIRSWSDIETIRAGSVRLLEANLDILAWGVVAERDGILTNLDNLYVYEDFYRFVAGFKGVNFAKNLPKVLAKLEEKNDLSIPQKIAVQAKQHNHWRLYWSMKKIEAKLGSRCSIEWRDLSENSGMLRSLINENNFMDFISALHVAKLSGIKKFIAICSNSTNKEVVAAFSRKHSHLLMSFL